MADINEIVGGYRLRTLLQTGQKSQVFEVVETRSNRHFAMKVLLPEAATESESRAELFNDAEVGIKNGTYQNLRELARDTMKMWKKGETDRELRMDVEYQKGLAEFHELKRDISETNYLDRIKHVIGHADL